MTPKEPRYRWYILLLATLTNALAIAIPSMCLSVLFEEISTELELDLVQVGVIWGIGSLPAIFSTLIGGAVGDRFGPKRVLMLACLFSGMAGALRGFATDFFTLSAAVVLFGFLSPMIPMISIKACSIWFPRRQLGLASGVLSMGMALGFMLGSLISATVLSPLFGGWRGVLVFYGLLAMSLSILWYFSRSEPDTAGLATNPGGSQSLLQNMGDVARIRNIWLMGFAIMGIGSCIQSMLGYLPLYLRGVGWPEASADGALSAFHLSSMIFVVPIALWSDRIGSRKKVLMLAVLMTVIGISLLSVVQGEWVWIAVVTAGMVRDGFMAVFLTMIVETDGIGPAFAGTATGLVMVFSGIGNWLAPPVGNSLANITPGLPFAFWAALAVIGFIGIYLAKEGDSTVLTPHPAEQIS